MENSVIKSDLFQALYKEYGSLVVGKKDAAKILGVSVSTLDQMRYAGRGVPYKQAGLGNVKYNLHTLVQHILTDEIETA